MEAWQLHQRQANPLEVKIAMSGLRIREWYEHFGGQVYVSFSGGWDSTVMLHLIRQIYPEIKAWFCNTGLEFPEIVRYVRQTPNCEIVRPEKKFPEVIAQYGWPLVSKQQALYLRQYRESKSEYLRDVRWNGKGEKKTGKISEKWKFLIKAPFAVSERCCYWLKKRPARRYHKRTGRFPFIGIMAADSWLRQQQYLQYGCNSFDTKSPQSRPLAFWTKQDIRDYSDLYGIQPCSVYEMGYERTGCLFCGFGLHMEAEPNRFQRLEQTHPRLWKYCIEKLGMGSVLDYLGEPYHWKQLEFKLSV